MIKKIIQKNIIILAILLLGVNIVYGAYGVSYPTPNLELTPGDEGRFQFTVQNTHYKALECFIELDNNSPLSIEMDIGEGIPLEGNSRKWIYGSVFVPEGITYGEYVETFCVKCNSLGEDEIAGNQGAAIQTKYCEIPIKVNVVNERTKDNLSVPQKPLPAIPDYSIIFVIIILVLAILAIMKYSKKQNNVSLPSLNKKRKRK